MASLVWDQIGLRVYQTGLDRGVLYAPGTNGVAWNGLISVEENFNREIKSYYLEGIKYFEYQTLSDFSGKLKAITYPYQFEEIQGVELLIPGMLLHDQPSKSFGLSYRTRIGNDLEGPDLGYEIHIIWNLLAVPDSVINQSMSDTASPVEFSWTLSAVPEPIAGHRPTAHISFRSVGLAPETLTILEELLYGTDDSVPTLPSLEELIAILAAPDMITIVDNGDGTWTAIGPAENISMLDFDTFQIVGADASNPDANTYEISTTILP